MPSEGMAAVLPGWPVQARNRYASTGPLAFSSPVLGNFDADTLPEVFISVAGDVMVIDGNGGVLTHIEDRHAKLQSGDGDALRRRAK